MTTLHIEAGSIRSQQQEIFNSAGFSIHVRLDIQDMLHEGGAGDGIDLLSFSSCFPDAEWIIQIPIFGRAYVNSILDGNLDMNAIAIAHFLNTLSRRVVLAFHFSDFHSKPSSHILPCVRAYERLVRILRGELIGIHQTNYSRGIRFAWIAPHPSDFDIESVSVYPRSNLVDWYGVVQSEELTFSAQAVAAVEQFATSQRRPIFLDTTRVSQSTALKSLSMANFSTWVESDRVFDWISKVGDIVASNPRQIRHTTTHRAPLLTSRQASWV